MPSARNISGNIAKLLGRPESEGWVFVRLFQDAGHSAGLFNKGHGGRGGAGAFAADGREAVLLLLAMAAGTGPKEAVADAVQLYLLPLIEGRRYALTNDGERWEAVPGAASDMPAHFGDALALAIERWRSGSRLPLPLFHAIRFGVEGNSMLGEAFTNRIDQPGDPAQVFFGFRYGRTFPASAVAFPVIRSASFSGAILEEIAKLLGPASASSGGDDLTADNDGEDADDLIAEPLAAGAVEQPRGRA